MVPSRCSPIEIANCGMPCRKLVVPSSGSTIQVWLLSCAFAGAAFLADEAVARPRLGEVVVAASPRRACRPGDEIGRPLQRHLKIFDLAEVALEAAAGAARGFDHDVDKG